MLHQILVYALYIFTIIAYPAELLCIMLHHNITGRMLDKDYPVYTFIYVMFAVFTFFLSYNGILITYILINYILYMVIDWFVFHNPKNDYVFSYESMFDPILLFIIFTIGSTLNADVAYNGIQFILNDIIDVFAILYAGIYIFKYEI